MVYVGIEQNFLGSFRLQVAGSRVLVYASPSDVPSQITQDALTHTDTHTHTCDSTPTEGLSCETGSRSFFWNSGPGHGILGCYPIRNYVYLIRYHEMILCKHIFGHSDSGILFFFELVLLDT